MRQIRGQGHYAHAKIRLAPGGRGTGYTFENHIVGGAIPKEFIQPIDDGIQEALAHGVLGGYPVDDVRIELYDGSFHDIDSSEMAFKIAGSMAFQDAAKKAEPVLLEPIMRVELVAPEEFMGEGHRWYQLETGPDRWSRGARPGSSGPVCRFRRCSVMRLTRVVQVTRCASIDTNPGSAVLIPATRTAARL